MNSAVLRAAAQGTVVLTASNRLARSITESFSTYQRNRGSSVWATPAIRPWNDFLERCWRDWLLTSPEDAPVLLSEAQQAVVWESVISESPAGRTLLRIPETADRAMDAWQLIHAYRLPFTAAAFSVSDDCGAFFEWASEYQARCAANRWTDSARLPDLIACLISQGSLAKPAALTPAGFDDPTPQQSGLLAALGAALDPPPAPRLPAAVLQPYHDASAEIRAAAIWARQRLEADPSARIGVIVPGLHRLRAKVDHAFNDVLGTGMAYHISLGPPLRDHPVVHAALLILELAAGPMPLSRLGMLLRSPFMKGAARDQSARANIDAALRRQALKPLGLNDLPESARFGPLEREVRKVVPEQYASDWSRTFARLLKAAGWPGDTISSAEHQAIGAWSQRLSALASLDAVQGRMDFRGALARVRKLAANDFQPENRAAPVAVMGLFEASGLTFDHLWVMGLHDEAMPPIPQPNPFLPIGLQRKHQLPHCSPDRELEFNTRLLARLAAGAPDTVFSYPQWEGDQPLFPTPLLAAGQRAASQVAPREHAAAMLETLIDNAGPPIAIGSKQTGGTSVLRDMAACPFRAHARYRLSARALEEPRFGIDARERGMAVHDALEAIWGELKTHAALCAMPGEELHDLIARSVDCGEGLGMTLERERIIGLLTQWLEVEKARPPFEVIEVEAERPMEAGGLRITARIDRVDRLNDGSLAIIDYKTGLLKGNAWAGRRLDEPQVPLYCISRQEPIGAAAFAQLRAGELQFRGVAENGEMGAMKDVRQDRSAPLSGLVSEWRDAIDQLASGFREGVAVVDPKQRSTCDYCDLTALCRIRDSHPGDEVAG